MLEKQKPLKPKMRQSPLLMAGHTQVPPPVPDTKRQAAGQRGAGVLRAARRGV